jgi:hypothetical protein
MIGQVTVGIDVGCHKHRVAIVTPDGRVAEEFDMAPGKEGFEHFFARLDFYHMLPMTSAMFPYPLTLLNPFSQWRSTKDLPSLGHGAAPIALDVSFVLPHRRKHTLYRVSVNAGLKLTHLCRFKNDPPRPSTSFGMKACPIPLFCSSEALWKLFSHSLHALGEGT